MNITVIGCGRWGSLITWYLDHIGHRVTLYGRAASPRMQAFLTTRHPEAQPLKDGIEQFPAACRGHHAVEKGDGLPTVGIAVYLVIECSAVYLKFCHSE